MNQVELFLDLVGFNHGSTLLHYIHNNRQYTIALVLPKSESTRFALTAVSVDGEEEGSDAIHRLQQFFGPNFRHVPLMTYDWVQLMGVDQDAEVQVVYLNNTMPHVATMNATDKISNLLLVGEPLSFEMASR